MSYILSFQPRNYSAIIELIIKYFIYFSFALFFRLHLLLQIDYATNTRSL